MAEQGKIHAINDKKVDVDDELTVIKTRYGTFIGKPLYDQSVQAVVSLEDAYEMSVINQNPGFTFFSVGEITEIPEDVIVIEISKKSLYYKVYKAVTSNI